MRGALMRCIARISSGSHTFNAAFTPVQCGNHATSGNLCHIHAAPVVSDSMRESFDAIAQSMGL